MVRKPPGRTDVRMTMIYTSVWNKKEVKACESLQYR